MNRIRDTDEITAPPGWPGGDPQPVMTSTPEEVAAVEAHAKEMAAECLPPVEVKMLPTAPDGEKDALKDRIAELEEALRTSKAQHGETTLELKKVQKKVAELEAKLAQTEKERNALRTAFDVREDYNERLQKRVRKLEGIIVTLTHRDLEREGRDV